MIALSILAWLGVLILQWRLFRKYERSLVNLARSEAALRTAHAREIALQKEFNANKVRERFHVVK